MKKLSLKSYYEPTPKNFRKLGDTILIIGTTITGSLVVTDHRWLAIVGLVLTVTGKVITNFFSEDATCSGQ